MSDLNERVTYRHDVTGLVAVYPVRLGDNDPHLKRVKDGAKPLTPALIPKPKSKSTSGDAPRDKKEEE
jgi:hypothetical protein